MSRYFAPLFLLCLLCNISIPHANSQNSAFQELSVGINLGQEIGGNELLKSWETEPGIHFNIQTPFFTGTIDGGIRHSRFNSSPDFPTYSDFQSTYLYLGWGYSFDLSERFSTGPVLRFGNTFYKFDEAKLYPSPNSDWAYNFDTRESEFSYEVLLRSEYQILQRWKAHAEISYNRTLTYHPVQLTFLTVGFSYSFDTPSWFQNVLK